MAWHLIRTETERRALIEALAQASLEEPLLVWADHHRPKRTLVQNALIHAIINDISRATGMSAGEVKRLLKLELLGKDLLTGEEERTSRLSEEGAAILIECMYAWAAENGLVVGRNLGMREEAE